MKLSLSLAFFILWSGPSATGCSRTVPVSENGSAGAEKASPAAEAKATDRVEVYYFHGDRRCPACLGIQRAIEETLREKFAAETAAGKLVYREANIDQPEKKHFVEQFELSFSTMVVAEIKDNKTARWENCQGVWDNAHEQQKLKDYVTERVTHYLAGLDRK